MFMPSIHDAIAAPCASMSTTVGAGFDGLEGHWDLAQGNLNQISGGMQSGPGNNNNTCPVNTAYTITGTMGSNGSFTLHATENGNSAQCADTINYSGTLGAPSCSRAQGTWTNSANQNGTFDMSHNCVYPSGETTPQFQFFGGVGNYPSSAVFRSNLISQSFNWGGRTLSESFLQSGSDTCYFPGSQIQETLTGSPKSINLSGNVPTSYDDAVGADPVRIDYYRRHGRTPCDYTFHQTVSLDCSGGGSFVTNTLLIHIGETDIISGRGPTTIGTTFGSPAPEAYMTATLQLLMVIA
jgi:hypothetical protein